VAKFSPTNAPKRSRTTGQSRISKCHNTTQSEKKVKTMLLPIFIFLMILFPVLLPAGITAVDAIKRAYRRNRPAILAPRGFAVPAAA
jgi:hypothetical protein